MSDARRQCRLALGCFKALGANPFVLVYPVLLATGTIACTVGFAALALFGLPGPGSPPTALRWLAVVGYFTVIPVLIAVCNVAFAYEINEVYEGRSPTPGAGLHVVLSRAPLVLAAALALGPGSFLLSRLQGVGPIGTIAGAGVLAASSVATVFAFPIVATTDREPSAAFEELTTTLQSDWEKASVSAVSTRALGTAITWTGIVTGVPLLFLAFWGVSFVSVPPWGPFTVPVALPFISFWLALAAIAVVRGVVNTALYRYARTGSFPTEIDASPDTMLGAKKDDSPGTPATVNE